MTSLQRLLLIPCASPLILLFLVAGLNLGKSGSLRILTWQLPTLPIGAWMVLASTTGAVLGCGGILAAGASSAQQPLQREVRRPYTWEEEISETDDQRIDSSAAATPWPERDVRDPAPTVSVPFRIIRTGRTPSDSKARSETNKQEAKQPAQASSSAAEDWHQPISTDW